MEKHEKIEFTEKELFFAWNNIDPFKNWEETLKHFKEIGFIKD